MPIAKKQKRSHKSKFNESDLKITASVVAEDADRKSAEYREKIRNHFDQLKLKFPSLTCADYARANRSRFKERTFQKWCSTTRREEDRKKIKCKTEPKPESASRRGYKDITKAERTRFTNAEKYGFILEWESAERDNPDITTVECRIGFIQKFSRCGVYHVSETSVLLGGVYCRLEYVSKLFKKEGALILVTPPQIFERWSTLVA